MGKEDAIGTAMELADIRTQLRDAAMEFSITEDLVDWVVENRCAIGQILSDPDPVKAEDQTAAQRYRIATIPVSGAFLQVAHDQISGQIYFWRPEDGWTEAQITGDVPSLPGGP